MSFRKYGGTQFASSHNIVKSNVNTTDSFYVTQNVGQPNTYINFESDISGNVNINGDLDITGNITSKYMFMSPGTNYTTAPNGIVPKSYVDSVGSGLKPLGKVIAISSFDSSGNNTVGGYPVPLGTVVANPFLIDGVSINVGDNVLLNDQGTNNGRDAAVNNGVYQLNSSRIFIRSTTIMPLYASSNSAFISVSEGTVNSLSGWVEINDIEPNKVGTTPLIFSKYYSFSYRLGQGLYTNTQSGQIYINVDSSLNFINYLDNTAGTLNIGTNTNNINIGKVNGSNNKICVTQNGVGINNNNPSSSYALDVNGNINSNGTIYSIGSSTGSLIVSNNIIMGGVFNTNYIQFPDGSKQYTAPVVSILSTSNNTWTGTNTFNTSLPTSSITPSSGTQLTTKTYVDTAISGASILGTNNTWTGTNTFNTSLPTSTITPTTTTQLTTKGYVDSVASNATNVASVIMKTYNTANYNFGGTFSNFTTTSNTQYADIYVISAGGCNSKGASYSIGATAKSGGGAGGGGGVVMYSRIPMGYINLQYRIEPQFVNTYIAPQLDTIIWSGTITQSGTSITLASTTSGAVQVGCWIQLPNTTLNYQYINSQLYIVGGSGTTWTCLSSQGQTISTATSANAAFNNVCLDRSYYWTGTFTQSGNTITLVSNTTGSISTIGTTNCYIIANGVSYTIQAITANSGTTLTSNCSQNISTAMQGAIYGTPYGTNIGLIYASLQGCENSYTGYPYIAYTTGGICGTNGTVNNNNYTYQVGTGGNGGTAVAYVPTDNIFNGGKGNNGTYNDDVTASTTKYSYGGQCPLLVSNTKTINSVATNLSYAYNAGATIVNRDTSYFPQNQSNCGGVLVVCYSS